METDRLTDRMGTESILPIKRSISIDTMITFDGDGDGGGTCKQAFIDVSVLNSLVSKDIESLYYNKEFCIPGKCRNWCKNNLPWSSAKPNITHCVKSLRSQRWDTSTRIYYQQRIDWKLKKLINSSTFGLHKSYTWIIWYPMKSERSLSEKLLLEDIRLVIDQRWIPENWSRITVWIPGFPLFLTDKIPWYFHDFSRLFSKFPGIFFIFFKVWFPSGFEYKYANLLSFIWTKN